MPYTVNICQLVQIVDGDRAQNRSEPRRSVTQASQSRPQLDLHSKDNYDDDNDVATLWLVSWREMAERAKKPKRRQIKTFDSWEGGKGGGAC